MPHSPMQAMDKDALPLEIGIMIGIASLTLTIFAPIVGYFVSFITHSTLIAEAIETLNNEQKICKLHPSIFEVHWHGSDHTWTKTITD